MRRSPTFLLLGCMVLAIGCQQDPTTPSATTSPGSSAAKNQTVTAQEIVSTPLSNLSEGDSSQLFTQVDNAAVGLEFKNFLKQENYREYLLNGAGVASGDINNDGLVDLYLVSQDGPNKLFVQTSPWKFEDVTDSAGVAGDQDWDGGASFADINNDGLLDLYLCVTNGPNKLFVNQGDNKFKEESEKHGVSHSGATTMSSFADYDNDGDLDLYLLNNRVFKSSEEAPEPDIIQSADGSTRIHPKYAQHYHVIEGRLSKAGQRDVLLRNDNGKFVDVTDDAGINGFDMGLSATWWDFDNDGWLDIYVANDMKTPDHLYRNLGNGKFEDVIEEATGHTPWFSMGSDYGDINNDGLMDYLAADMSSTTHYKQKTTMGEMGNSAWFLVYGKPRQFMRNTLMVNSGQRRFWEAANLTGLDSTDWTWSVRFFDCDCDGMVDVFFTNGYGKNINDSDHQRKVRKLQQEGQQAEAAKLAQSIGPLDEMNRIFRNRGNLRFEDVSESWGANHVGVSNACSTVDIDRDGDLDLIVSNLNEPVGIYRNDCTDSNRVLLKLQGTSSNRFGVGCTVELESPSGKQIRQLTLARGYMASNEPIVHFGLGDDETIDKLTVQWPSGIQQVFENLEPGNLFTITEMGDSKTDSPPTAPDQNVVFKDVSDQIGLSFRHAELPYDDFQHQPLLPNKLSQLGPGIAWADVNGDDLDDCYVCGARGQIGSLYIRSKEDGVGFELARGPWSEQMSSEEMSALFVDFDSDGDQDLYVVNGGYEVAADSELLQDVLYINDGTGAFTKAGPEVLPELRHSGSSVCAADFDRDGDLDLFVGTRMTPRLWPMATSSTLLRNDDGKLVDATKEIAPDLINIGLVTGSIWSDADGDGWTDLLLSLEWGPVKLLKNDSGRLVDATSDAGLAEGLGWWNSISAADVDNDGDTDYVVMNTGLNTKYHADPKHPIKLFAHDFDGNGRLDLVESEWEGDKCFPIRGKSCSTHAMPMISEKFPTYHEFALAEITDIYGDESLSQSAQFTVNNLSSVLLINNGDAKFEISELPRLAQISPGFGVAVEDFDGDGNCDIAIAQNFMHPQPETGQMDGGLGLFLKGNGTGQFESLGPMKSGIMIPEQGMGVAVVDLNFDQLPDLVVTTNDGPVKCFENQATQTSSKRISVRVDAGAGNPAGTGCRVQLRNENRASRIAEVYSGSGYLSQSPGQLFFVDDQSDPFTVVEVRLPNGEMMRQDIPAGENQILVNAKGQVQTSEP